MASESSQTRRTQSEKMEKRVSSEEKSEESVAQRRRRSEERERHEERHSSLSPSCSELKQDLEKWMTLRSLGEGEEEREEVGKGEEEEVERVSVSSLPLIVPYESVLVVVEVVCGRDDFDGLRLRGKDSELSFQTLNL